MINAAPPYRREDRQAIRVPVVMPLVEVDVDQAGSLSVTLDHEPYSADGTLTRDDLKRVLDDIATDLGTAVRVEVHESDESTFTDIVTPEPPKLRTVQASRALTTLGQIAGEVAGDGFLPNEEVSVAVVVAHQLANSDGTATLRLPPALLEAHPGLVVLMGKRSGTVRIIGGVSGGLA